MQVLRTYLTQYTRKPTSEQYVTVYKRLIGKFRSLKDTGDSPFVSKVSLSKIYIKCLLFRHLGGFLSEILSNFQRKGSDCQNEKPPSKQMKFHLEDAPKVSEEEYEEAIQNLKAELKKGGKRVGKYSSQASDRANQS